MRDYRRRLDLDPAELARIEERLSAIHDAARKHRVRPEALPALIAETEARLAALAESADAGALAKRAAEAEAHYRALAEPAVGEARVRGARAAHRVTEVMQELAMAGGRLEIALEPRIANPRATALEQVEFHVASHPKQPLGPLAKVASGGELSRIALAIQVVTSEVGDVPTLIFDEVDAGIGGAVAATVGRSLQTLGARAAGAVRHAPAAGRGVRRRALARHEGRPRQRRRQDARAAGRRGAHRGACADARRQRDHREDARAREGAFRAAPPRRVTRSTFVGVGWCSAPRCCFRRAGSTTRRTIRRPPPARRRQSVLDRYNAPGAVAGVWRRDVPPWKAAFGVADVATGRSMTLDDYFSIRSITKSFVVTALLLLARDGALSLDDPIGTYVHGIPNGDRITLTQLAAMESGVKSYTGILAFVEEFIDHPERVWTDAEIVAYAIPASPVFDPGAQYDYSNTNTILIGMVIEKVAKASLADVLRTRIFEPLGLRSTSYPSAIDLPSPHPLPYAANRSAGPPRCSRSGTQRLRRGGGDGVHAR